MKENKPKTFAYYAFIYFRKGKNTTQMQQICSVDTEGIVNDNTYHKGGGCEKYAMNFEFLLGITN